MKNGIARSPLFYVGDKYKLIREIKTHFPNNINRFIEPFVGGGSVMMNVDANCFILNDINGFVQSNGYVSMEAEHFTGKTDRNGAGWETIATLGRSGDTMAVFPTTTHSRDQTSDIIANSPVLEYQVYLWDVGQQKVTLYCIPTHAITSERGLRYAAAFDDQTPQIVGFDTVEWSSQWNINVLQGAAVSESTHTVSAAGSHTLKIWMVDPGVVIDKIVIGNAPASHLGPPETAVQ